MNIPEQIIIVKNHDGDILAAVRPIDPLNPGFDVDELEAAGFETELTYVESTGVVING